jgi:DNA-binding CsgD family transcriptional regulator
MSDRVPGIHGLIDRIYAAALQPQSDPAWPEFLLALERHFPGGRAILALQDARAGRVDLFLAPHYETPAIRSYGAHYAAVNPWMLSMARRFRPGIHTAEMLVPERTLVASEFYNDWLRPQGLHCGGGCTIYKENDRLMAISVLKPRGLESVTAAEADLLRTLLPHLERAAQLRRQFLEADLRAGVTAGALDLLATGIILLRPPRCVLLSNRAAQAILQETPHLTVDRTGAIRARRLDEDARLEALLADAFRCARRDSLGAGGALAIEGDLSGAPLSLLICPFYPGQATSGPNPTVMMFLAIRGRMPAARPDLLIALYGLTPAEALVLSKLVAGLSAREIAAAHRVARNTVRNQIQRLLEKTATSRQSELIAKVFMDGGIRL